jgi:hypothetical protein
VHPVLQHRLARRLGVRQHRGVDAPRAFWYPASRAASRARRKSAPPPALLHRDRGCRFPGCGLRFCQGHHLRHWAYGGPTTLDNLALLCRRHHRAVHEEGFQVERHADGGLRFRRPDGQPIPEVPPPVPVPADPVGALWARHRVQGLTLHARSLTPSWQGERLDLAWAIGVLHPLAT